MSAQEELRRLGLFDLARSKLVEAHKLMDDACELINQGLDNLKPEKSVSKKLSKTLDSDVHVGSTIKLNVGGKIYKTTLETLRKIQILCCVRCFAEGIKWNQTPKMGHILLTAMVNFSGKFACAIERKAKTNFTFTKK